jgi:hypothetical protein
MQQCLLRAYHTARCSPVQHTFASFCGGSPHGRAWFSFGGGCGCELRAAVHSAYKPHLCYRVFPVVRSGVLSA